MLKEGTSGGSASQNKFERDMRTTAHVQCYKCGTFGHFKRECRSKGKYEKDQGGNRYLRVNDDHRALLVRQRKVASNDMIVDFGPSSHMFYERTMFSSSVQGGFHRMITIGDGRTVSARMAGTVCVETKNGQ